MQARLAAPCPYRLSQGSPGRQWTSYCGTRAASRPRRNKTAPMRASRPLFLLRGFNLLTASPQGLAGLDFPHGDGGRGGGELDSALLHNIAPQKAPSRSAALRSSYSTAHCPPLEPPFLCLCTSAPRGAPCPGSYGTSAPLLLLCPAGRGCSGCRRGCWRSSFLQPSVPISAVDNPWKSKWGVRPLCHGAQRG